MSYLLGIDTGLNGALAFLHPDTGDLVYLADMPTRTVPGAGPNGASRQRVDPYHLYASFMDLKGGEAFIERPVGRSFRDRDRKTGMTTARPVKATNTLEMGVNFGLALMAAAANGYKVAELTPGAWKRKLGLPGDKDEVRQIVIGWYPKQAHLFKLKKHDGRAEATALARLGLR